MSFITENMQNLRAHCKEYYFSNCYILITYSLQHKKKKKSNEIIFLKFTKK